MIPTKIEDLTFEINLDGERLRKLGEAVSEAAAAFSEACIALAPAMERIAEAHRLTEAEMQQKDASRRRREMCLGKPEVRWR